MKSPQAKSVRLLQERHQENLEIMLKNLLKDETLSDITLHCRDGAVRAHRVILAASSPYFKKVFQEHPEHQVAFLVHGIAVKHIKSLVELIYRGSTQIPSDMTSKFCDICEDFGMKGIVDENDKLLSSSGRDTRYRGQKRVTVDFENDSSDTQTRNNPTKCTKSGGERRISGSSDKSFKKSTENLLANPWSSTPIPSAHTLDSLGLVPTSIKQEPSSPSYSSASVPSSGAQISAEARRRNNWAMKQRKYKCSLCPASFKRASHLSRHQLVHTGERPYSCDQCDKAFSRHDKLKHHVRKAHALEYMGNMMDTSMESDTYTMGNVKIDTPDYDDTFEEPSRITREDLLARMRPVKQEKPEPEPIQEVPKLPPVPKILTPKPTLSSNPVTLTPYCSTDLDSSGAGETPPQKKGRGRPRKYPPVPKPLIKRPRGRPRLNQSVPSPQFSPGFSPTKPPGHERRSDQYDITNMPYGDLEYLTKSMHEVNDNSDSYDEQSNSMDAHFMEPLVEIELDQNTPKKVEKEAPDYVVKEPVKAITAAGSFLQNIGLLENSALSKMEIGECTVSVSQGHSVTEN